jgi:hypothetical protein
VGNPLHKAGDGKIIQRLIPEMITSDADAKRQESKHSALRANEFDARTDVAGDPGRAIVAGLERQLVHDLLAEQAANASVGSCYELGERHYEFEPRRP